MKQSNCNYIYIPLAASILFFSIAETAFGQVLPPPGISEFKQVNNDMVSIYNEIGKILSVIGVIFGLLGALRVYNNWQYGKEHVDAAVAGWFGSCIFLNLVNVFIKMTYGI